MPKIIYCCKEVAQLQPTVLPHLGTLRLEDCATDTVSDSLPEMSGLTCIQSLDQLHLQFRDPLVMPPAQSTPPALFCVEGRAVAQACMARDARPHIPSRCDNRPPCFARQAPALNDCGNQRIYRALYIGTSWMFTHIIQDGERPSKRTALSPHRLFRRQWKGASTGI